MADHTPTLFYVAQALGAVGFFLVFVAPLMRSRARFLVLDIAGLIPVTIHYAILNAPAGAVLCALYIVMDLASANQSKYVTARLGYWLFYPLAGAILWIFYGDGRDLFALGGTLLAIASRQQSSYAWLKFLIFLSAFGWGVYGFLVDSFSQVIFSISYAASSLFGAFDEIRRRPPPP